MPKRIIIFGTGSHNAGLMAKAKLEGAASKGIGTSLKSIIVPIKPMLC